MNWKFVNLNPLSDIELDCVCRAITNVTGRDYYDIEKKLCEIASLFECEQLCVCCYKFLLDYVFGFKRIEEYQGRPIKEFLEDVRYGTYLVRIEGHLSCIRNGYIEDTWDCSNWKIDIIWQC